MDLEKLKKKVADVLRRNLDVDSLDLRDIDGISGYVVSRQFLGMTPLDRQTLIHRLLHAPPAKFTAAELRQVLAIAALTPVEYEVVMSRDAV